MQIVMNRIQKLFPEDSFEDPEQDGLMNKIRVPKNILYLSDRLPKPRYMSEAIGESNKRKTSGASNNMQAECSLPLLPTQKKGNQKRSKYSYLPDTRNEYGGDGSESKPLYKMPRRQQKNSEKKPSLNAG